MSTLAAILWKPVIVSVSASTPATARGAAGPAASDEALMLRYRDGDEEAFRALYTRYRTPLMRFSQRLCGRASEAEEVFQDTWIAVINARARYAVRAKFATWLFSIAHRRAADGHRSRMRRPTSSWTESQTGTGLMTEERSREPPERAFTDARQRALATAIAALPFEQREVFLLRVETGLGLREIAAITHSRPEATKSRLRYALRALRKAMTTWA